MQRPMGDIDNPDVLTDQAVKVIQEFVRDRDRGRCLICSRPGAHVHELLQKSSGAKNSARVFRPKYMGCLCAEHHIIGVHSSEKITRRQITAQALHVLSFRYGYVYPRRVIMYINRNRKRRE